MTSPSATLVSSCVEVPDVVVVAVHVDELVERPVVVDELALEPRVALDEVGEDVADGLRPRP